MTIDVEKLLAFKIPEGAVDLTPQTVILYALGIGLGAEPTDERQLGFLYEERLQALPTFATVLATPGFWLKDPATGVDWVKSVHGEQGFVLHRPLPVRGRFTSRTRITGLVDKGPGEGALIYQERVISDAAGEPICTATSTAFCRGGGGFGGENKPAKPSHRVPERKPDIVHDFKTLPQAALIYRLSGDYNPLHIDPQVAAKAGFPRPILHGLCTYGVAGYALVAETCAYRVERLIEMNARFSAPVYPGETIRTEIWVDGADLSFQSQALERQTTVLSGGYARLKA